MIEAASLVKRFGRHDALRGIDLAVATGELFALIGPDGAGKTTFFRLVAGVITPTSGTVRRDPGATFGLVPQRFSLYEDLTVDENLDLRASLYSVPAAEAKRRGADLLARVGMDRFGKRLAGDLSGGAPPGTSSRPSGKTQAGTVSFSNLVPRFPALGPPPRGSLGTWRIPRQTEMFARDRGAGG